MWPPPPPPWPPPPPPPPPPPLANADEPVKTQAARLRAIRVLGRLPRMGRMGRPFIDMLLCFTSSVMRKQGPGLPLAIPLNRAFQPPDIPTIRREHDEWCEAFCYRIKLIGKPT